MEAWRDSEWPACLQCDGVMPVLPEEDAQGYLDLWYEKTNVASWSSPARRQLAQQVQLLMLDISQASMTEVKTWDKGGPAQGGLQAAIDYPWETACAEPGDGDVVQLRDIAAIDLSKFRWGLRLAHRLWQYLRGLRWPQQGRGSPVTWLELALDFEVSSGTLLPCLKPSTGAGRSRAYVYPEDVEAALLELPTLGKRAELFAAAVRSLSQILQVDVVLAADCININVMRALGVHRSLAGITNRPRFAGGEGTALALRTLAASADNAPSAKASLTEARPGLRSTWIQAAKGRQGNEEKADGSGGQAADPEVRRTAAATSAMPKKVV